MLTRKGDTHRDGKFDLGYNIFVPRGMFKNDKFPLWLIRSGCIVQVIKNDLMVYHRDQQLWIEEPRELIKWLHTQYQLNRTLQGRKPPIKPQRKVSHIH